MSTDPVLEVVSIYKTYGSTPALEDVSFEIERGRIHALVGENGAGKSTLVKIITGIIQADSGKILLNSSPVHFATSTEARSSGVAAVYQDPKLFVHLDIAENIFLGNYPTTLWGSLDRKRMYSAARLALDQLGVRLDPRSLVAGLSVAEMQFVEIARALSTDLKLLILDEPTSALTPAESDKLFSIVKQLRATGKSILLITHRLEEVEAIADTITILRDGHHVATKPASEIDRAALVRLMVGRSIESLFTQRSGGLGGEEVLRVEAVSLEGVYRNVSFVLRRGEILGMAGLVGAGRTEIAQSLFGINPPTQGRVFLDGREVVPANPGQMLELGLAYLPEDRDGQGLIMPESVTNNITLPIVDRLARFRFLNRRAEQGISTEAVTTYEIKTKSIWQPVGLLSGGNRQKVAFAKWLATDPKVLILDEPTHGIDIGSKAQVHKLITRLADRGIGVVLISSDLPEILAIADRILVIAEGRLVRELPGKEATQEEVMAAATFQPAKSNS